MNMNEALRAASEADSFWFWLLIVAAGAFVVIGGGMGVAYYKDKDSALRGFLKDSVIAGLISGVVGSAILTGLLGVLGVYLANKDIMATAMADSFKESFEEKYGIGYVGQLFGVETFKSAQKGTILGNSDEMILNGELIRIRLVKAEGNNIDVFYSTDDSPLAPLPTVR